MNSIISIPELVNYISDFLSPRDIVNFSFTCSSVYESLVLYNRLIHIKWEREWKKYSGDMNAVKYLVSKQAELWLDDDLLIRASKLGHLDTVKYILDCGDSIFNKKKCITHACRYGHFPIVEYFISIGVKPKIDKWNLIPKASSSGNLDLVKYLVNIATKSEEYRNIYDLFYRGCIKAAKYGHFTIVKYFIETDSTIKDRAIIGAAKYGHFTIVKYLYDLGISEYYKIVALQESMYNPEIFEYLLERETEKTCFTNLINYAAAMDHLSTLKYLISKYPINQDQKNGALIHGVGNENPEIVDYLLSIGAYASTNDNEPIIKASCVGDISIVKSLVEAGADINARDGKPLIYATARQNLTMMEYIKEKNKNI